MKIYVILLVGFVPLCFSDETPNSYLLLRLLILEYPSKIEIRDKSDDDEVNFIAKAWRFAAETNNLAPWKTIPMECAVKDYVMGKDYVIDLERVSDEASIFASRVDFTDNGKNIWIFNIN